MTIERSNLLKTSGAIFSDCEKYRYALFRWWDENLPRCVFVMLNPSTADENANDPTVARCIEFAKHWGYGSLGVVNLFAWRATDPKEMFAASDPIGPENDFWIAHVCLNAQRIVCAWGNHGSFKNRAAYVLESFQVIPSIKVVHALKINGPGEPAHPLYQPSTIEPVEIMRKQ